MERVGYYIDNGLPCDGASMHRVEVGHGEDWPALCCQINADQFLLEQDEQAAGHVALADHVVVDNFGSQIENGVLKKLK